ncbi:MAG: hypothetical protein HY904_00195 [Deltaproteobacteria bacterium]|nr:hypothetical protein [Deltaproteobacteria bacterium]
MTTSPPGGSKPPFERKILADQPGILGAQWWQEGLKDVDSEERRRALGQLLVAGGIVTAAVAVPVAVVSAMNDGDETRRPAMAIQQQKGWDFGADGAALSLPEASGPLPPAAALASLVADLAPALPAHRPYYSGALFSVLSPVSQDRDVVAGQQRLATVMHPIETASMREAQQRGTALAGLLTNISPGLALIVDLPGLDAVAFAAGTCALLEPVFAFDNWPHPRGVVPSHLALAAVLHHRERLMAAAPARRGSPPPVFVLDRNRLAAFTDPRAQFDNRYLARVPGTAGLKALGIDTVLYVAPGGSEATELDDLNEAFVAWQAAGITVQMALAAEFTPDSSGTYYWGGSSSTHGAFHARYPFTHGFVGAATNPPGIGGVAQWRPAPRTTQFHRSVADPVIAGGAAADFGTMPVVVASSGLVMAAAYGHRYRSRSSWFRFHFHGG